MFQRIADGQFEHLKPTVISKSPWVIYFDQFLTEKEADEIYNSVGPFERSTDVGARNEFGEAGRVLSQGRTSENAWCRARCENNPHTKAVIKRMEEVTMIPYKNYESFQVLRYSPGQFYRTHHDMP